MELKELIQLQKYLNKVIMKRSPADMFAFEKTQLLNNNLIAIQTEIAELANELRTFKYWSKKPNFFEKEYTDREKALEEFIDVLHFVLSIIDICDFEAEEIEKAYLEKRQKNIERQKEGY